MNDMMTNDTKTLGGHFLAIELQLGIKVLSTALAIYSMI
jgi:hypothetical protein